MDKGLKLMKETGTAHTFAPRLAAGDKASLLRKESFVLVGRLAAVVLLLFGACQGPKAARVPAQPVGQTPGYLTMGDVVKVSFTGTPELNQTQRIGSDGKVSLPLIGEVYATGKSVGQLQAELARLYKPQLQNSEVIVTLESRAVPVVVSGAVQKPGKITFERPATLLEAIMEAGGFAPEANLRKVSLIR